MEDPKSLTTEEHTRPASSSVAGHNVRTQEEADRLRSELLATESGVLPKGYFTSTRLVGTFVGTSLSLLSTYFILEAGSAAITDINADIGPSVNSSLFTIVWTVAQPISTLLFGRLSDRFGRRNFALGANCIGIIGGIIGSRAQTMNTLIGAMVLLGLASGIPASYPLLTGELAPNKGKFLAAITVVLPNIIATGFGPYIGDRLIRVASWRWIYYIYLMMIVPGTVCWFFFYHPPSYVQLHGKKLKRWDEFKKIDFVGIFLLVSSLTLLLLGVSWGGESTATPWNSALIIGLLASGCASSVAFVLWECFANLTLPIIPMRLFRDVRGFACIAVLSAAFGAINTALFIVWPSQVTHIFGTTNKTWQQTAWMSCTMNFGLWFGDIFFGSLYAIIKRVKWQLVVGSGWMCLFIGLMSTLNSGHRGAAVAISFLSSWAIGWGELITMLIAQYLVSDQDLGIGFAVISAVRTILGSVFTGVQVAILANKLPGEFEKHLIPALEKAGLPSTSLAAAEIAIADANQTALAAVPGMNSTIIAIANQGSENSYAAAYSYMYYAGLALALVAFLASFCLRDLDQYLTSHVSRQIYHKDETKEDVLGSSTENVSREESEGNDSTEIKQEP